jgi:hypothetical protein
VSEQRSAASAHQGLLSRLQDLARARDLVWERWTIDEIDEGMARVLVARARAPEEIRAIADRLWGEVDRGGSRRASSALRRLVALIEVRPPLDQWAPEEIHFFGLTDVAPTLAARRGKPGLPGERPLREGDVFWVLAADEPTALALHTPAGEREVMALRLGSFDVWDVTAAARQVAKRSYHHAVRMAGEPDESGQRRG